MPKPLSLASAAAFALFAACLSSPAARAQGAPDAVPVIVAPATQSSDEVALDLLGSAQARQSVTLFPAVAGEVRAVRFRTGERVRAGQVLLQLDDRTQRLDVELAAARLETARAQARRFEATRGSGAVPESEIDEALATLRAAEIELAQAREALSDRVVLAPFDGVVGIASVDTGERVSADTALTTLDDRRSLLVDFQLPEAYLARVQPAQTLRATNPAYPDRAFEGTVSEVDSRIDPVTRTVRVRATLPNTEDRLRPGMSFQLRLLLQGQPRVSVPELALQFEREGPYVWAVREGNAQKVAARPVRRTAGRVLIDSELRAGEQVVVEGVQRVRQGRPVRVIGGRNGNAP